MALHGLLLAAIAWRLAPVPSGPPPDPATVEVEYVNQAAAIKGAPNPEPTAPSPAAAAGDAGQPSAPAPPPPPPNPFADVPMPRVAPPAEAAARSGQPAVNIGDSDEDRDALQVTGDNVVSSGPDARYRNMPPNYPHEAARRHQQGSVMILVHITETGEAGEIEMVASSGSESLDDAATLAVSKWHFKPAFRGGAPVPSVYQVQLNFRSEQR